MINGTLCKEGGQNGLPRSGRKKKRVECEGEGLLGVAQENRDKTGLSSLADKRREGCPDLCGQSVPKGATKEGQPGIKGRKSPLRNALDGKTGRGVWNDGWLITRSWGGRGRSEKNCRKERGFRESEKGWRAILGRLL